jgi:hypothetical protein
MLWMFCDRLVTHNNKYKIGEKRMKKVLAVMLGLVLFWPTMVLADRAGRPGAVVQNLDDEDDDDGEMLSVPRQSEEDDWVQRDSDRVQVDISLINRPWRKTPFDGRYFDIPERELAAAWPRLMRGLLIPYPSADYLKLRIEHFPELRAELGPGFDGDYDELSRQILHAWRLFFRGDFRAARDHGRQYGAYGKVPGYFAQIIYAIYLAEKNTDKHQFLQDAADQVAAYVKVLREMRGDPRFEEDYMMLRLGYAYAIARIAEDVPPAVALGRNYLFKISGASNDVLDVHERHPVGLAFRAGIDANLIRVMGKAAGRLTFGARQSRARDYFEASFAEVDDMAVIHYEFANALLYMNKARDAEEVLDHLTRARNLPPGFAMEALDSMYAAKRLREVEDFLRYGKSFRNYERQRRAYVRRTDENLYCVTRPPFLLTAEQAHLGAVER